MSHRETPLSRDTLYQGRILTLHQDTVELENGKTALREIVEHHGGVAILAVVEDQVLLVRQYRHAAGQELLELPAGKLELGEEPSHCALRELEEETGYRAERVHPLGQFYATPGYCTEQLYLYAAEGLTLTRQQLDEDEFLSVQRMPVSEALAACKDGRIQDAKTALALLLYQAQSPGSKQ